MFMIQPLFWFIRKDEEILQSDQILQSRKPIPESGDLDKEYGNWKCVKGLVKKKKNKRSDIPQAMKDLRNQICLENIEK